MPAPLDFAEIDWKGPVPVPPRALNGGLYTGEPFAAGAPWGNVPRIPEAHAFMADASPFARTHIPGYTRPGNNEQPMPLHRLANAERHTSYYCGVNGR